MLEQRIQQQFFESADLLSQSADALSRPIAQATQALLICITGGGKVLVAGGGAAAALAPYAAALWAGRFERERPPLTAIALGSQATLAAMLAEGDPLQALAKEVRALGAPGDVLLAIATGRATQSLVSAIQAALAKDMTVIALTGPDTGVVELLSEADVHIAVPHERAARVFESHALVLHCLADAVDLQLMGEQDSA